MVATQFMENLKRIKKATIPWAHAKQVRGEEELSVIEAWIISKMDGEGQGFLYEGDKEDMV